MSLLPRENADDQQQPLCLIFSHAEAADADRTDQFWKCPTGKRFRVDSVDYINPTGLAEHSANHVVIAVKNAAVVIASYATDSDLAGADNSIPADEFIALTMTATDSEKILEAGDVLSFDINEEGTTTLPAGTVVVHGRYV